MKIALIDVNATRALGGGFSAQGSRLISALLKRAGHSVKFVFLARQDPFAYKQDEIERLHEILKDVDLAMVAVYSACAHLAIQVTDFIHRKYPGMKVIWGGPHCIAAPELSLRYADGVCFSEGDECVVEFVNRLEAGNEEYLKTPNMAFNINGSPVVNDALPPFKDLDSLPFADYSLEDQFVLDGELFSPTKEKAENYFLTYPLNKRSLFILTSRGCPHQCSYCNNCRYVALFGYNQIRFHSVARFMEELETHLNHFGFFTGVGFSDDDFFLRPVKELEDFAERYKRKIGLPFGVTLSANTYRREKMEILLDAGMEVIQMGVQSASQRVLDEVYNRKISVAKTREVIRQIEPYQKTRRLSLILDFIIDNPYETREDIIQTYRYLIELPRRAIINIFNLVFFPGTPIYNRAVKDGIVEPQDMRMFRSMSDSYRSMGESNNGHILYQQNYETFLLFLAARFRQRISPRILRFLGSRPLRGIASLFPKFILNRLFPLFLKVRRTTNRKPKPSSKAIEQSLNSDSLYFSRGLVYEMQGKKAEAIADFKKCITLSNNPELIKMAKRLAEEYTVK
jgi:anaerobic magnesium-protoporphyrin IX monomethyl ester cyclase